MNESVLSSVQFYDSLSEIYDAELERRAPWVRSVDSLIIEWGKQRDARTLVDFGCGNGRRVLRLLQASGLTGAAIDVSPGMIAEARRLGVDAFVMDIASPTFDVRELQGKFDLVICTWNVLGHIEGHDARLRTMNNMRALMAPGGAIVLDVNNRYNASHYGWRAVLRNLGKDAVSQVGTTGDFVANRLDPDGNTMHTFVHVFSPREVETLCEEAGLIAVDQRYIDYDTGAARTRWSGQMCYLIEERL